MIPYNKKLVSNARTLRKNMTPEEKHLWYDFLKRLPYNVRRQHNIENYIVDFYIAENKIVIEVDGRQHLLPEHKEADEQRAAAKARELFRTGKDLFHGFQAIHPRAQPAKDRNKD